MGCCIFPFTLTQQRRSRPMTTFPNMFRLTRANGLLLLLLMLFAAVGCEGAARHQLTASGEPGQGGTVAVDPAPGPDIKYPEGAQVRLQAKPREGYQFSHWSAGALELGRLPVVCSKRGLAIHFDPRRCSGAG